VSGECEDGREPCLVWGGYGYGNTGDDLTLAVALHDLDRLGVYNVGVITPRIEHTRQSHPYARLLAAPDAPPGRMAERLAWRLADRTFSIRRNSHAARLYHLALRLQRRRGTEHDLLAAFTSAASLHLVGGGYLTDLFDLDSMLRPIRIARAMNRPVTTSPLGLGPFRTPRSASAVARALQACRVTVRDSDSLQYCQAHQLEAGESPDDGFRLAEVLPPGQGDARQEGRQRRIGVCVFHQYDNAMSSRLVDWWVDCLRLLSQRLPDFHIEGFCFHTDESMDLQTTRLLFERSGLNPEDVHPPEPDYRRAVMLLDRFDAIFSTRFHAVVAASALRRPCVAVGMNDYYDIKMKCALKHSSIPSLHINPLRDSAQSAWQFLSQQMAPTPGDCT